MKNIFKITLAALAAALLSVSCAKDIDLQQQKSGYITFSATLDASLTKTHLDGVQVHWDEGDEINLWYGTLGTAMEKENYSLASIDGSDPRSATFQGFALESDCYMAIYPKDGDNDCSKKGKITTAIPTKQKAVAGSFAKKANVAVAYSTTTDLSFQNIGGLLALKVASTGGHLVKKIRLSGTSALSGQVEIKQADLPGITEVTEGVNYLVLNCGDGIADPVPAEVSGDNEEVSTNEGDWGDTKSAVFSGDNVYYLVALPGSHTGFTLTLIDDAGQTAVARSTRAFDVVRNGNTLIANLTVPAGAWKADPATVVINEIHPHLDQVEFYNSGSEAVDMSGWLLEKDDKSWAFPVGTTIAAGGFLTLTCGQASCATGPTFGISADKGFDLVLSNGDDIDEVDNSGDDRIIFGETETYGRSSDGGSDWAIFIDDGTIGSTNAGGTIKTYTPTVALNEINGNDKYVELYNYGAETVDLTGFKLTKDGSVVWTASDASQCSLAAGAYLAIDFVKKSTDPTEAASGISAGKNLKVELLDASSGVVDTFTRGEEGDGWGETKLTENTECSFSRVPDGTGDWKYAAPTKGEANGSALGSIEQYPAANGVLVLNELDGNTKFIEIYNTSTDYPISLEDATLWKDDGETAIWTGAAGCYVAPGGFALLWSEDVAASHTDHPASMFFSSGLSPKKTVKIELKDASGESLDVFTRGASPWGGKLDATTFAFGRTPDGSGSWQLVTATPDASNGESQGDIQ